MAHLFESRSYLIRRKILTIFGASFHIYDDNGALLGFSRQKAFKLKEDIRIYADEAKTQELLTIKARQIVDFSAAYDIVDATTGVKAGACRRKGWTSILRDAWELLDDNDQPVGKIVEDSAGMAMARRFLSNLIPQKFHITDATGLTVAVMKQRFNPFVYKLQINVLAPEEVDPRVILGASVLLAAIEGRQG